MTDLQFVAAIVTGLAWPAAVVVAAALLRKELGDAFKRMRSVQFPGGKVEFAILDTVQKTVAAVAKDTGSSAEDAVIRYEATEFSMAAALASTAPWQAVLDAWALLEYQLNVASDRLAPGGPHGWPQVASTLAALETWPALFPAVLELRRLRDYTALSGQVPSSADAARYVTVARELAGTLRSSNMPVPEAAGIPGVTDD